MKSFKLSSNLKDVIVFFRKAFLVASSGALQSLSLFLRMKIIALIGGPSGVGILSLAQSHSNVFIGVSSLSAGNAFTRDIANQKSTEELETLSNCLSMGLKLGFLSALVAGCFWGVMQEGVDSLLPWSISIGLSVFGAANFNQLSYALRGLSRVDLIVKLNISIFLFSLFAMISLYLNKLDNLWLYFLVVPFAQGMAIFSIADIRKMFFTYAVRASFANIFSYLIKNKVTILFLSTLAITLCQLVFRIKLGHIFGLEGLGFFQLAFMISSIIMLINTTIMSSVFLPMIAKITSSSLRSYLFPLACQLLINYLCLSLVLVLFIFFGEELIVLLASDSLTPALPVLFSLLLADAIRCVASPLAYIAFSKGDVLGFIGGDLIASGSSLLILFFVQTEALANTVLITQTLAAFLALVFLLFRILRINRVL